MLGLSPSETIQLGLTVLSMVLTAGVVYGSIRGDLKLIHQRLDDMRRDVDYNRDRIDSIGPRLTRIETRPGAFK